MDMVGHNPVILLLFGTESVLIKVIFCVLAVSTKFSRLTNVSPGLLISIAMLSLSSAAPELW